jgi:hypothetical protein
MQWFDSTGWPQGLSSLLNHLTKVRLMTCSTAADAQTRMTAYEQWYDSKDENTQSLIDEIHESTHFIVDEDEYDAFINLIEAEGGITTAEQFCDAFNGECEGVGEHITTKFAEDWCDDVYPTDDLPDIYRFAIDFEMVWYQSLRHDFYDMEFKGNTYFFNRNV